MAQKKDKSLENPARDKAKELVDQFVALNMQHSIETNEEYGMSYEYHKKCAIALIDAQIIIHSEHYEKWHPTMVAIEEIRAELVKLEE